MFRNEDSTNLLLILLIYEILNFFKHKDFNSKYFTENHEMYNNSFQIDSETYAIFPQPYNFH